MNRRPPFSLACLMVALVPCLARTADDRAPAPIEVYEWSVWVGNPARTSLNVPKVYRNAMPPAVGTSRPVVEGKELDRQFAVAPISVVQAFGDPTDDVDFDLQVKKGTTLAHWPGGTERSNGVRWFKSNLSAQPPAGIAPGYVADNHWFQTLRRFDSALYFKHENRAERFLAYDVEAKVPVPIKLRGGPDEYTLVNLTEHKLVDVAIIAPAEGGGYRVGWLDALPTAVPKDPEKEAKEKAEKEAKEKTKDQPEVKAKAADAVFEAADAEAKAAKDKEPPKPEAKPLPAEGDANIRARVDQALNRPVEITIDKAPRKDYIALIAGQARLRYETDDVTLTKADIDLGQPMSLKTGSVAARDALAEILGSVGLTYRVGEDGGLFITTAARLSAETSKKAIIEGPPVKLTLGQPIKPDDPSFAATTRDAYARRLVAREMRADVVKTYLDQYAPVLFQPDGLIVIAHLSREAIDEAVVLDVFPTPKKLVRSAAVVVHGIDPRLQDQARGLIAKLGDVAPKARDDAEFKLFELGAVAVPVLEDALKDKDIEIVYRAERVLMKLNHPVP